MSDIPLINFTNYTDHPTERNILVYTFKSRAAADDFQKGLEEKGIWFEKDAEGNAEFPEMTLFAVKKQDAKESMNQNYMTTARHRKPFMPDKLFRFVVLFVTITLVTLAIIGFSIKGV